MTLPLPDAGHAPDPVADRGSLTVSDRAVARIIAASAAEVEGVGGPVTRLLGQSLGSADPDAVPKVSAVVSADLVTAQLQLSVRWPAPVLEVVDQVRARVQQQLAALADLRTGHLDIAVTALPVDRRSRRRVA